MCSTSAFIPSAHASASFGSALCSSFTPSCCSKKRARSPTTVNRFNSLPTTSSDSSSSSSSSSPKPSSATKSPSSSPSPGPSLGRTPRRSRARHGVSTVMSARNGDNERRSISTSSEATSNNTPGEDGLTKASTPDSQTSGSENSKDPTSSSEAPASDIIPITIGSLSFSVPARSLLYIVPFLWGSFAPAVRFLFAQNPHQEASVFNSERLLLSTLVYTPILWREVQALQALPKRTKSSPSSKPINSNEITQPTSSSSSSESSSQQSADIQCIEEGKAYSKNSRFDFFPKGIELGVYVFIANIAQVVGLQQTSASRAAFLVQLQTVFVPILGSFLGFESISFTTGLSSAVAILGVALLSSDKGVGTESSLTGDGLEIFSALFFSWYIVRLSRVANKVAPNPLVATKIAVQALLSIGWATVTEFTLSQHSTLTSTSPQAPWTLTTILISVSVVLWTGLLSSAFSGWAQTKGQQAVPPSEAALIFATQPLWATGLAAAVLGEKFGNRGIAGGGLIVLATLIPTLAESLPFFKNKSKR